MDDILSKMYLDISASLLAISNALEKAGVLSKAAIAEAAIERLATLRVALPPEKTQGLAILEALATAWTETTDQ